MQQTAEVGKVLCEAMKILPSEPNDEDNEHSQSKRPRLTDLLDEKANIGSSSSSMIDAMNVHRNLARFPILAFSNEPISHLANKEVKKALDVVPDQIFKEGKVSEEIHIAYLDQSAYDHSVVEGRAIPLSESINIDNVVVNDGDGIILGVNPSVNQPLENATYTRLNRIDAPELFAVHYVRNQYTKKVLEQFKGHWSLLGLRFFLDLFVRKGTAQFHYQLPRTGKAEPIDFFKRPLKEYWFKFLASPSERELRILDAIIETCDGLEANQKAVLMSLFDPRLATAERPFYLSLNALLVLSGNCHVFTRFCQDQRLLDLQGVAKANHIGPLYCGLTKNHVIGIEVDTSDDVDLSEFAMVTGDELRNKGYPNWYKSGDDTLTGLLPWHERAVKEKVSSFTRQKARDHIAQHRSPISAQYGFFVDIDMRLVRINENG